MSATTAIAIETAAFTVLNVFQPGEQIPSDQAESARGFLNRMIGSWAQQRLTIPSVAREVFGTVSGKGGPANPYTIGIGGDLNTARPPNQASVVGAGLVLPQNAPTLTEIPRAIYTDDDYQAIAEKTLPNGLFTGVYYNPTFTSGFGSINLWPVPDNALNSLVLYLEKALTTFATLYTIYNVPDAYEEAMVYNLARRLAKPWGATVDADLGQMATSSLSQIKRTNVKMNDMPNDFSADRRLGYNIQTGNY